MKPSRWRRFPPPWFKAGSPHHPEEVPLPATPFILPRLWHRAAAALRQWGARDFERRYLATLNDSQLWDMRLSRRDVREEAAKPFWRA